MVAARDDRTNRQGCEALCAHPCPLSTAVGSVSSPMICSQTSRCGVVGPMLCLWTVPRCESVRSLRGSCLDKRQGETQRAATIQLSMLRLALLKHPSRVTLAPQNLMYEPGALWQWWQQQGDGGADDDDDQGSIVCGGLIAQCGVASPV